MSIQWTDDLSVKVDRFDNEHKNLILMINKLRDAMHQGKGREVLGDLLVELADYTVTHFKGEEEAMQKHNYPDFAAHKKSHDDFVKKVSETKETYDKGTATVTASLCIFLSSWITQHIKKADHLYGVFFDDRGIHID